MMQAISGWLSKVGRVPSIGWYPHDFKMEGTGIIGFLLVNLPPP